jgi:predicted exporter
MMTPERFRELLLDHAYGLLDGADEAAMQQYVESHADANWRACKALSPVPLRSSFRM